MKTTINEFLNENKKTLKKFLEQFPNDATSWKDATDEVRDIARTAKEYYNELNKEGDTIEPLDFRSIKTPSDWNTKGKEYIMDVYGKMDKYAKEQFDDYLLNHFNIKI